MAWKEEFAYKLRNELQLRSLSDFEKLKRFLKDYLNGYFGVEIDNDLLKLYEEDNSIYYWVNNKNMEFKFLNKEVQIYGEKHDLLATLKLGKNKLRIVIGDSKQDRVFEISDLDKLIELTFKDAL